VSIYNWSIVEDIEEHERVLASIVRLHYVSGSDQRGVDTFVVDVVFEAEWF